MISRCLSPTMRPSEPSDDQDDAKDFRLVPQQRRRINLLPHSRIRFNGSQARVPDPRENSGAFASKPFIPAPPLNN